MWVVGARVMFVAVLLAGAVAAPCVPAGASAPPALRVAPLGMLLQSRGGDLTETVPVTLDVPSIATVTVDYFTLSMTGDDAEAVPGRDYVATSGTLTFAPGQTQRDILVRVLAGTIPLQSFQYAAHFHVQLQNAVGATIGRALADIEIQPTMDGFRLQSGSTVAVDNGTKGRDRVARITFSLTQKADHAVTGDYSEGAESAQPGIDFVAKTGSITIPAGKLSATITIKIMKRKGALDRREFVIGLQNIAGVPGETMAGAFIVLPASTEAGP